MSAYASSGLAMRLARAQRIDAAANRIFVSLRNETRAARLTNDDVAQLLELAEALATATVDGRGRHAREACVIARACAALDAQRAASNDLRTAIARVRDRLDDLLR